MLSLVSALGASATSAAPVVVTDIPPVQSLVTAVMAGIGTPALLYRPDDSPHGSALRPSSARLLQSADLVVWIGPALTPPLARMIDEREPDIVSLALLLEADTRRWTVRHAHGHDRRDDHDAALGTTPIPGEAATGGMADDTMDNTATSDTADHSAEDSAQDSGIGIDTHAWLDPDNAIGWTRAIARTLALLDPDNATAYAANAASSIETIASVSRELERVLAPVGAQPFLVAHDSLQYLERRFGLTAGDSIAFGDATPPGPATLDAARRRLQADEVACLFAETGEDARYIRLVADGTSARVETIDPRGIGLELGADLYTTLLQQLGSRMADCLSP